LECFCDVWGVKVEVEVEVKVEIEVDFKINWNVGMVEYWNNGMAPFGQINACGGKKEAGKL
jgi:hypothetical protein